MTNDYDPYYLSEEKIKNISGLCEGFDILLERELFFNYIDDLDDIKELLKLKYHSKPETVKNAKNKNLYENYPKIMEKLTKLLFSLKNIRNDPSFKREIRDVYKVSEFQVEDRMKELEKMIKRNEIPILITGEAKAGKSTFINMLLGEDILPVSLVTCTRIICEIKKSAKRTVTFTGKGKNAIVKTISDKETKEISQIIRQEIHPDYTKATYEYPVKFLENYTYLVDSPSIGDSSYLENMTFEYLKNCAPAIIFVLDATNYHELSRKAQKLIEKAKTNLTKEAEKFITDSTNTNQMEEYYFQYHKAIFILNNWDIIRKDAGSPNEVEMVRLKIIKEIKKLWHESVEENEQIFFISALQANEWQKHNIVQTEVINIRNRIKKLVANLNEKNILNSLQKARFDGILQCHHICFIEKEENVLLVLDAVDCNLQTFLYENKHLIPGQQKKDSELWRKACSFILDVSMQICQGIQYLHLYEPRMVHPDLRLDTILIRKTNNSHKVEIFICDACSNLIAQKYPKKSAKFPDIQENLLDMGGYTKENILRLGELFYKLSRFEEIIEIPPSVINLCPLFNGEESIDSFESNFEIDWENEKHLNVPNEYNELIRECVSYKPENRPSIDKIIETLKNIRILQIGM